MANVNVTYQEMQSAADRLVAGRVEIQGQLEALQRQVEGLVSGGYVTDRAGDMIMAYVEPGQAGSSFSNALLGPNYGASDLKKIQAQLRVVSNNSASTPNGGAVGAPRRAATAP